MTSLLHALAYRLQEVGEELPVGQVASAADRLRSANGLLAWVMHASATRSPTPTPALTAASEHLDHAAGAMLAAREALTAYLISIGLPRDPVPPPDRDWHTVLAPPPERRRNPAPDPKPLANFWSARVDHLTDRRSCTGHAHLPDLAPDNRKIGAATSAELLHLCAAAVRAEDRSRLCRDLSSAGAGVGLGLSAVAPAPLRFLAAELVGRPPSEEDLPRVREAVLPRIRPLLPTVDEVVVEQLLARACHAPPPPSDEETHPVDRAVTAAVLVAVLLRATDREPDELARVIKELEELEERDRA
ncbi:hypothetical protein WEI85_28495 [Actinomycetes bacterium KLBMP 9797]